MANRMDGEADACIFQWEIKNISLCWWLSKEDYIESPVFVAEGLQNTIWTLLLHPVGDISGYSIGFYLSRDEDCSGPDIAHVKYQLALLDKNGSVFTEETQKDIFTKKSNLGFEYFEEHEKIFITDRKLLLSQDTLTLQCTIWYKELKPVKAKHIYAQTVFEAYPRSLVWKIDKFSSRKLASRNKFMDALINFDLVLIDGIDFKNGITIIINSFDDEITHFSIKTYIIDSHGKKENCGMNEYFADDLNKKVLSFELNLPMKLMEQQGLYLPNDVLCLFCEFVCTTEITVCETFGGEIYTELKSESAKNNLKVGEDNSTVLTEDLKSMYSEGIFSDMELRTSTQAFPTHKAILSARSPVFRRMFSNDMKEKNSGHVDISDLDDDTAHRMLLYLYTDILEDLQFESACKLYAVSDKYDIFSLKNKCSSFLKENLCPIKACDVLILADQHHDEDLKKSVQDYLLDHEEVFSSQEWIHFMDNNIRLAADVMYKKINHGMTRSCIM